MRAHLHKHRHIDRLLRRPDRIGDRRQVIANIVAGQFQRVGKGPHQWSQFPDLFRSVAESDDQRNAGGFGDRILLRKPLLLRQFRPQFGIQHSNLDIGHARSRDLRRFDGNRFADDSSSAAFDSGDTSGAIAHGRSGRRHQRRCKLETTNFYG